MTCPVWDDAEKKKIRELVYLVLAFVVGSVIFLPSLSGTIQPPHVFKWALLFFLCFSLLAFIFLCFALYFTFTGSLTPPHASHGFGNFFAILSFVSISLYLIGNIYSTIESSPTISDISITPVNPKSGSSVLLKGYATDKDKDTLNYTWIINDEKISSERFAYYFINDDSRCIEVKLSVEDSSGNAATSTIYINVENNDALK